MNAIQNASLYLTRYPSDLHKKLPFAKSDGGLLRKATRVDFVISNQPIRFNIMPKADTERHLAGFAGYIKSLCDRGINSEAEIRNATAILPNIVCVLGGVFSKPFSPSSEIMEMLFVMAHHYKGYVFLENSLLTPDMKTVCGPLKIQINR